MRTDGYRVFSWLLVIALSLLPLRTMNAMPVCDSHGMHSHFGMPERQASVPVDHRALAAGAIQHHAAGIAVGTTHERDCRCCDHGSLCAPDCGMGLHVSAVLQSPPMTDRRYLALPLTETSDSLLTRLLAPPSRPPLPDSV